MKPFVVPAGEFTFRDLCVANPSVLPMNLLKFVTQQVTEGKMIKNKGGVAKQTQVTYVPVAATPATSLSP